MSGGGGRRRKRRRGEAGAPYAKRGSGEGVGGDARQGHRDQAGEQSRQSRAALRILSRLAPPWPSLRRCGLHLRLRYTPRLPHLRLFRASAYAFRTRAGGARNPRLGTTRFRPPVLSGPRCLHLLGPSALCFSPIFSYLLIISLSVSPFLSMQAENYSMGILVVGSV